MSKTTTKRRSPSSSTRTNQPPVRKPPAYRQRDGYDQALVTLTDSRTKRRRDYWLGPYGSAESRELYHRLIAEWEANNRRWPTMPDPRGHSRSITVNEVIRAYWRWVKSYYSTSEATIIRSGLRILRRMYGTTPALDFGPKRLRLVRDVMIKGDTFGMQPRQPWSRRYVNGQVRRLCALFKWAASHELVPASIYEQLRTVSALRRGRSEARASSARSWITASRPPRTRIRRWRSAGH